MPSIKHLYLVVNQPHSAPAHLWSLATDLHKKDTSTAAHPKMYTSPSHKPFSNPTPHQYTSVAL